MYSLMKVQGSHSHVKFEAFVGVRYELPNSNKIDFLTIVKGSVRGYNFDLY